MVSDPASPDKARTEFLVTAVAALGSSLNADELLAELARCSVPTIADWCAIDLLEDGHVRRAAVGHPDSADREIALGWWDRFPVTDPGNRWILDLAKTRESSGVVNVTNDVLAANPNEEMAEAIRALHIRQTIVVPLINRGHFFGALTMIMADSDRVFEDADARLCEELGPQIAGALENARLYAAEQQARRRESKLHALTASLSKATTSGEVAEVTCRLGAEASDAPIGALWLLEASGSLALACHWG
ncbi:MAG: GAF domain-containing protein, partial [Polyangiaceae bacterium]